MDLTRNTLIFTAFIILGFVALTAKMWILGGRRHSFKYELRESLAFLVVFAAIAALIIYTNNY